MQEMVDPIARLGDTLTKEVAILDGPSQDTSTNVFEFSPPSSTSSKPSQCNDQHPTGPVKVVTLRQTLTNKAMELQEKWDVSQVPINLQDYMLHQFGYTIFWMGLNICGGENIIITKIKLTFRILKVN
jgi:hypothetical protein